MDIMTPAERIGEIFHELEIRYDRISYATIGEILKGKRITNPVKTSFTADHHESPLLEEVKAAFASHNCAIFTAFIWGLSLDENLARNAELKKQLDKYGLHYRPVKGCYYVDGMDNPDVEINFFVANLEKRDSFEFFRIVYELSEASQQECFLYTRSGINEKAFLVATNDRGREKFRGSLRYAGQLHVHVPDYGDWTNCKDDRFAFQLRGMAVFDTNNRRIKIGEGNAFNTDDYNADGLVVIRRNDENDIKELSRAYSGEAFLTCHTLVKNDQTEQQIHRLVIRYLNEAQKHKSKRICLICSAFINGSYSTGAQVVLDTVTSWIKTAKKVDWVLLYDSYGNYARITNQH